MITLYVATSLDGYIARENGGLDWLDKYNNSTDDYGYNAFIKTVDVVVMGKNTYDAIKDFSPYPYADKKVYIFSHSSVPKDHGTQVATDVPTFMQTHMKGRGEEHVFLVGGGQLIKQFHDNGYIDSYIIFVMPDILEKGIPLFPHLSEAKLELTSSFQYVSGAIRLEYRKAQSLLK